MNYVEHRVNTFRKQTKLPTKLLTFGELSLAANKIGYIVKPYSTSAAMMIALGVYDEAMSAASVSIKDNASNVVIFINDTLSADKQLFALAHEIGHIYLGHNNAVPKEKQEEEANKFANYLLNGRTGSISCSVLIISLLAFSLILSLIMVFNAFRSETPSIAASVEVSSETSAYIDDAATYYWTEAGYVFHYYRDCQALAHSDTVLSGELSEAQQNKERLCKFCEQRLK